MDYIVAFDLALNHVGWALIDPSGELEDQVHAMANPYRKPTFPMGRRLAWVEKYCHEALDSIPGYFEVWKEAPVGQSFQVLKIVPVHGVFDVILWNRFRMVPREVSPKTIKVLATNDGNAEKPDMISAAKRRLGMVCPLDWKVEQAGDAADALWTADFAARLHGFERPELPPIHLRAMNIEEPA